MKKLERKNTEKLIKKIKKEDTIREWDLRKVMIERLHHEINDLSLRKISGKLESIEQVGYYRWKAQYMLFYTAMALGSLSLFIITNKPIFMSFSLLGAIGMIFTHYTMRKHTK